MTGSVVIPSMHRMSASSEAPGAEAIVHTQVTTLLPEGLIEDDEVVILLLRPSLLYIPLSSIRSIGRSAAKRMGSGTVTSGLRSRRHK